MDMLNVFLARRSVRQYADEPIPEEKLIAILQAGLSAPSSKNRRPWEFILIRERGTLAALADCRGGAAQMLKQASAAIVVCGDQENVDVWVEDCACAMANMHVMASSMGVGSCWIQARCRTTPDGRDTQDAIRDLLGIPAQYGVMAVLSLGMPAQPVTPRTPNDLPMHKVHREHF